MSTGLEAGSELELGSTQRNEVESALTVMHQGDQASSAAEQRHKKLSIGMGKAGGRKVYERLDKCTDKCGSSGKCLFCCCCWTFSGLREMLTSGSTLEFALGFIIGEQFGAIIYSMTESLVAPLIFSVFDAKYVSVESKPGFLILTNPNDANVTSAVQAREAGCRILDWDAFFQSLLSFIVTMITAYWLISTLQKYSVENKHHPSESPGREHFEQEDHVKKVCMACKEWIHADALRCRFCTTFVDDPRLLQPLIQS